MGDLLFTIFAGMFGFLLLSACTAGLGQLWWWMTK